MYLNDDTDSCLGTGRVEIERICKDDKFHNSDHIVLFLNQLTGLSGCMS